MNTSVHILNGDSTSEILKQSGISGDLIVWREMLSEGPVSPTVGNDEFWGLRYGYFESELKINKIAYYDTAIKELIKIEDLSSYKEVVLWFEYDLFCQVNLMALCTYLLNHYSKSLNYYLVCVGRDKNSDSLLTLSDYASTTYQKLYDERIKLSRHDLLFARECWEQYVENDISKLKKYNFGKNSKFNYFQLAVSQHLKRFPENGKLNQIDTKILETIQKKKSTKRDIIKELLFWQRNETVYGFGDLQYEMYLDRLHLFYEIKNDSYYLNDKGRNILTK